MKNVEDSIEKYIRTNINQYIRILYKVTPQYKNKNQVPTGVLIEAKSLDTEYELCVFCYNLQSDVKINYVDGSLKEDNRGIIKTKLIQKFEKAYIEKKQLTARNLDLVVNSQTGKYHYDGCQTIKSTNPKYLKDITTKEQKLINDGYTICSICKERR